MARLPVVGRDPYKHDDDDKTLKTAWFDSQSELSYIARNIYNDDNLEFQLESTIAQFHGEKFAKKYALALINDSSTYDLPLERIAGDWFINYCESRFQEID
jgi:hypothetical protein